MSEIKDKVVIITGASSGLGEATARRLAKNGAKLMLAARREERLKELVADIQKDGGTAKYEVIDVTNKSQVEAGVFQAIPTFRQAKLKHLICVSGRLV